MELCGTPTLTGYPCEDFPKYEGQVPELKLYKT